jgi:hypothetical protein
MQEMLEEGEAIDLSGNAKTADGFYILDEFVDEKDYCDSKREAWIWSIGQNLKTGQILASTSSCFYQDPEYKCLFLR